MYNKHKKYESKILTLVHTMSIQKIDTLFEHKLFSLFTSEQKDPLKSYKIDLYSQSGSWVSRWEFMGDYSIYP